MEHLDNSLSVGVVHPLDLVERLAEVRAWGFERQSEHELHVHIAGTSCDCDMALDARPDGRGLHLLCLLGTRVPRERYDAMRRLLARINRRLWLGHFELWEEDGCILFRHALPLGAGGAQADQCELLIRLAIQACETYALAFQCVLSGAKTEDEAMALSLFKTQGTA